MAGRSSSPSCTVRSHHRGMFVAHAEGGVLEAAFDEPLGEVEITLRQ